MECSMESHVTFVRWGPMECSMEESHDIFDGVPWNVRWRNPMICSMETHGMFDGVPWNVRWGPMECSIERATKYSTGCAQHGCQRPCLPMSGLGSGTTRHRHVHRSMPGPHECVCTHACTHVCTHVSTHTYTNDRTCPYTFLLPPPLLDIFTHVHRNLHGHRNLSSTAAKACVYGGRGLAPSGSTRCRNNMCIDMRTYTQTCI